MMLVNPLMARSFSGKPIDLRNRLVRLTYLDEAGTSNPLQEPFIVVAGVILNADQDWQEIDRHLKHIMRKRLPQELQFTGIFHAKDIWHGIKEFDRKERPNLQRKEILADLAAIPARFHLAVVHGFVERLPAAALLKENVPKARPASIATLIHSAAFMSAAGVADEWMRNNAPNEVGMLIAEEAGKVKQAIKMFQEGYRHDRVDVYFDEMTIKGYPKDIFKTRNIIDTVHFAGKRESPMLQIADTCAFFIKRQLQGSADSKPYYDAFAGQMISPLTRSALPGRVQVTVPRSRVVEIDPSIPESPPRPRREPRR